MNFIEKIIYEDKPAPLTNGHYFHKIFAYKIPAFASENQVRLIVTLPLKNSDPDQKQQEGILVKVKLEELIEAVYLATASSKELETTIKRELTIIGLPNIPVKSSYAGDEITFDLDMNGRPTEEEFFQRGISA